MEGPMHFQNCNLTICMAPWKSIPFGKQRVGYQITAINKAQLPFPFFLNPLHEFMQGWGVSLITWPRSPSEISCAENIFGFDCEH